MILTVQQVADELQVGPDTVRGWIATGQLKARNLARKMGSRPVWRIERDALDEFLRRRETAPKVPTVRRRPEERAPTRYF
jgi:excisionase family DNA binding protein